ncbi:MAG: hypothetical protein ACYDCO_06610 [Armatimonadota bacterium]
MLIFDLPLYTAIFLLTVGIYLAYIAIMGASRKQRVNWRAAMARGSSYGLSLAVFTFVTYLLGEGFELLQNALGTIIACAIGYVFWFAVFLVMEMISPVLNTKRTIPGAIRQAGSLLLLLAFMHVLSVLVFHSSLDVVFRTPLTFVLVAKLDNLPFFAGGLQPFYSK